MPEFGTAMDDGVPGLGERPLGVDDLGDKHQEAWDAQFDAIQADIDAQTDAASQLNDDEMAELRQKAKRRRLEAFKAGRNKISALYDKRVEQQLKLWNLEQYSVVFVRAGYRSLTDLLELDEQKIRQLGVEVDADVRRVVQMVSRLQQEHRNQSNKMDKLYMDPDTNIRVWLERRELGEWAPTFEQHQISFEILGDLSQPSLSEEARNARQLAADILTQHTTDLEDSHSAMEHLRSDALAAVDVEREVGLTM